MRNQPSDTFAKANKNHRIWFSEVMRENCRKLVAKLSRIPLQCSAYIRRYRLKFSTANWLKQLENICEKALLEIKWNIPQTSFQVFLVGRRLHGLMPRFLLIGHITEINCPSLSPFLGELRPPTWDRQTFLWQLFFFLHFFLQ